MNIFYFKNQKGVTISALVITIIVLSLLLGITVRVATDLLSSSKVKTYITEMYMVQAKVKTIGEELEFAGYDFTKESSDSANANILVETNLLNKIGLQIPVDELSTILPASVYEVEDNVSVENADKWFQWSRVTLTQNGFDANMLKTEESFYYVNYGNGEIVYANGFAPNGNNSTEIIYSLTDMLKVKY